MRDRDHVLIQAHSAPQHGEDAALLPKMISLLSRSALALVLLFGLTLPAAADNTATEVSQQYSIMLAGIPATLDLGSALPGQQIVSPTIDLLVGSNDPAGYAVSVTTSAMNGDANQIGIEQLHWQVNGGTPLAIADSSTALQLALSHSASATGGDNYSVVILLDVPYTSSGDYSGSAIFDAGPAS